MQQSVSCGMTKTYVRRNGIEYEKQPPQLKGEEEYPGRTELKRGSWFLWIHATQIYGWYLNSACTVNLLEVYLGIKWLNWNFIVGGLRMAKLTTCYYQKSMLFRRT